MEQKFTLRDKGFKRINSNSRGDLIFTVQVQTPKRLSKEQRELFVELAKTMNEQPPVKREDFSDKNKSKFIKNNLKVYILCDIISM